MKMMGNVKGMVCAVAVVQLAGATLWGQVAIPSPGPLKGLASAYPGDEGIEKDPRVIYADDFETGTVTQTYERWGNASNPDNLSFSGDIAGNSPGVRSLSISKTGALFTHTRGVDVMYARFYVKLHRRRASSAIW